MDFSRLASKAVTQPFCLPCMNKLISSKYFIGLVIILSLSVPAAAFATVGVGVGSGKITVQKALVPGGIYELPAVPVLNTGDESSGYEMDIEYLQDQSQLQPPQSWFSFDPGTFSLDPSKVQTVKITLTVPVNAKPGDYFAYVEAHPVKVAVSGVTRINIAAAAKLYFTVAPANIFEGVYYRVLSFFTQYAPWTYIVLALLGFAVLISLFRRFFSFNLGISVRKKEEDSRTPTSVPTPKRKSKRIVE